MIERCDINLGGVLTCIRDAYGLNRLVLVKQIRGRFGSLALAITDDKRRLLAKRHGAGDIPYQNRLASAMRKAGLALIPDIIPLEGGEEFLQIEDARWSLHEFIDTDLTFDWTDGGWKADHIRSGAIALKQFHEIAAVVAGKEPELFSVGEAKARVEALLACVPEDRRSYFSSFAEATMPWSIAHGDFHPGNLLYRDDDVVGIVDFDYAGPGSPLLDFAYGCVMFAGPWSGTRTELDFDAIGLFVKTYGSGATGIDRRFWLAMELACHVNIAWLQDRIDQEPALRLVSQTKRCLSTILAHSS